MSSKRVNINKRGNLGISDVASGKALEVQRALVLHHLCDFSLVFLLLWASVFSSVRLGTGSSQCFSLVLMRSEELSFFFFFNQFGTPFCICKHAHKFI